MKTQNMKLTAAFCKVLDKIQLEDNQLKYAPRREVIEISEMMLDAKRDKRGKLRTDCVYRIPGVGYAVSPDGEGLYWYDTEQDARDNH